MPGGPRPDRLERQLAEAEVAYLARPGDRDAAIWYGRRLGYVGRFEEAVGVYTAALELHPDDRRLLRHRGHRLISLRRYAGAIDDLRRAADRCRTEPDEVEPDGLPTPGRRQAPPQTQ